MYAAALSRAALARALSRALARPLQRRRAGARVTLVRPGLGVTRRGVRCRRPRARGALDLRILK